MSIIRFTFEDLCAFFTSNQSRLMVGLISTEGEASENVHEPHIVIKQNEIIKREYQGFAEIYGDIALLVYPDDQPLTRHTPRSARDPRQSFSRVVDIEKDLYPRQRLHVEPSSCGARLHFSGGELYSLRRVANVRFADLKTNTPCENSPSIIATDVGLDVVIPGDGHAVLHFDGRTEDFIFESGPDYQVEVANRAEAMYDHFKYFYNIVQPKPEHLFVPLVTELLGLSETGGSLPVPRSTDPAPCAGAGFGGAPIFDFIAWLLGLSGTRPK